MPPAVPAGGGPLSAAHTPGPAGDRLPSQSSRPDPALVSPLLAPKSPFCVPGSGPRPLQSPLALAWLWPRVSPAKVTGVRNWRYPWVTCRSLFTAVSLEGHRLRVSDPLPARAVHQAQPVHPRGVTASGGWTAGSKFIKHCPLTPGPDCLCWGRTSLGPLPLHSDPPPPQSTAAWAPPTLVHLCPSLQPPATPDH